MRSSVCPSTTQTYSKIYLILDFCRRTWTNFAHCVSKIKLHATKITMHEFTSAVIVCTRSCGSCQINKTLHSSMLKNNNITPEHEKTHRNVFAVNALEGHISLERRLGFVGHIYGRPRNSLDVPVIYRRYKGQQQIHQTGNCVKVTTSNTKGKVRKKLHRAGASGFSEERGEAESNRARTRFDVGCCWFRSLSRTARW